MVSPMIPKQVSLILSWTLQSCNIEKNMSSIAGKSVFGVSDQVDTNPVVQPQEIARGLKFWI